MNLFTSSLWVILSVSSLCLAKTSAPISNPNWKHLIGDKAGDSYQVKKGDSLSVISQQELGDKEFWPKLWEVNQENVRNPHLLEPEQKILFSRIEVNTQRMPSNESSEQSKKKKSSELEKDQWIRSEYVNRHRLRFLLVEQEEVLGVITGSYSEKNYLGSDSKVYIGPLVRDKLRVGNRYAIVREVKFNDITKNINPELSGRLIKVVGEVQIEAFGDDLARAFIVSAHDAVERGDRIMDISFVTMQEPSQVPPPNLMLRVLVGDNLEQTLFSTGQMLLLDRGKTSGVQLGQVFQIYDDTDPVFNDQKFVEPRSKGTVKIVHLSERSSVGYLLETSAGVEVGDVLISPSVLVKPTAKIKTNRQPLLIE